MVAGQLLVAGSGGFFVDVFLDSSKYFVYRLKQTTHGTRPHCALLPMYFQVLGESDGDMAELHGGTGKRRLLPFGKGLSGKFRGKAQLKLPLRKNLDFV